MIDVDKVVETAAAALLALGGFYLLRWTGIGDAPAAVASIVTWCHRSAPNA